MSVHHLSVSLCELYWGSDKLPSALSGNSPCSPRSDRTDEGPNVNDVSCEVDTQKKHNGDTTGTICHWYTITINVWRFYVTLWQVDKTKMLMLMYANNMSLTFTAREAVFLYSCGGKGGFEKYLFSQCPRSFFPFSLVTSVYGLTGQTPNNTVHEAHGQISQLLRLMFTPTFHFSCCDWTEVITASYSSLVGCTNRQRLAREFSVSQEQSNRDTQVTSKWIQEHFWRYYYLNE